MNCEQELISATQQITAMKSFITYLILIGTTCEWVIQNYLGRLSYLWSKRIPILLWVSTTYFKASRRKTIYICDIYDKVYQLVKKTSKKKPMSIKKVNIYRIWKHQTYNIRPSVYKHKPKSKQSSYKFNVTWTLSNVKMCTSATSQVSTSISTQIPSRNSEIPSYLLKKTTSKMSEREREKRSFALNPP